MGKILNTIGRFVKRAVTKDGAGLLALRDELGKWDLVAAGALAIRLILAVVIIWIAGKTGITVEQILSIMNELGGLQ